MKRRHLVELEDLPWWPRVFRDAATDYLVAAIRHARVYDGLAPHLAAAVKRCRAGQVIDLCSGGGGPWPCLLPALRAAGADVQVWLPDKYPNMAALGQACTRSPRKQRSRSHPSPGSGAGSDEKWSLRRIRNRINVISVVIASAIRQEE